MIALRVALHTAIIDHIAWLHLTLSCSIFKADQRRNKVYIPDPQTEMVIPHSRTRKSPHTILSVSAESSRVGLAARLASDG